MKINLGGLWGHLVSRICPPEARRLNELPQYDQTHNCDARDRYRLEANWSHSGTNSFGSDRIESLNNLTGPNPCEPSRALVGTIYSRLPCMQSKKIFPKSLLHGRKKSGKC